MFRQRQIISVKQNNPRKIFTAFPQETAVHVA